MFDFSSPGSFITDIVRSAQNDSVSGEHTEGKSDMDFETWAKVTLPTLNDGASKGLLVLLVGYSRRHSKAETRKRALELAEGASFPERSVAQRVAKWMED